MGVRKNLFDISGELDVTSLKAVNREVSHVFSGMYGCDAKPHIYIGDRHIYMKSIEKIAGILIHVLQSGDLSRLCPVRYGRWQFGPRAWACINE